jgi:hypothetical protein
MDWTIGLTRKRVSGASEWKARTPHHIAPPGADPMDWRTRQIRVRGHADQDRKAAIPPLRRQRIVDPPLDAVMIDILSGHAEHAGDTTADWGDDDMDDSGDMATFGDDNFGHGWFASATPPRVAVAPVPVRPPPPPPATCVPPRDHGRFSHHRPVFMEELKGHHVRTPQAERQEASGKIKYRRMNRAWWPCANFSTFMIGLVARRNNISYSAVDDLRLAMNHPDFRNKEVRTAKHMFAQLNKLPKHPMYAMPHKVEVPTSDPRRPTIKVMHSYQRCLMDLLQRELSIPEVRNSCAWNAHVQSPSHLMNGRRARESPLFTQSRVTGLDGQAFDLGCTLYYADVTGALQPARLAGVTVDGGPNKDQVRCHLRPFWTWSQLEEISIDPLPAAVERNRCLPCTDWIEAPADSDVRVDPSRMIKLVTVLSEAELQSSMEQGDLKVSAEVRVCRYRLIARLPFGTLILRHVDESQGHPANEFPLDRSRLDNLPPGTVVYRVMLVAYYDDFRLYAKGKHKIGGMYLEIGNLWERVRFDERRMMLYACVPSDVDDGDALAAFWMDAEGRVDALGTGARLGVRDRWVRVFSGRHAPRTQSRWH